MSKGYCATCGSWENLHPDQLCHVHHYGVKAEGGVFPQGGATPEEIARLKGAGAREIVDVAFTPIDGMRRYADEARERALAEPVLGQMAERQETPSQVNRVSPAGADANERRKEPGRALPEETKRVEANVKGAVRDAEQAQKPPLPSAVNVGHAGDADLKKG